MASDAPEHALARLGKLMASDAAAEILFRPPHDPVLAAAVLNEPERLDRLAALSPGFLTREEVRKERSSGAYTRKAEVLAAYYDSLEFLKWSRAKFGPFQDVEEMIPQFFHGQSERSLRWLLESDLNRGALVELLGRNPSVLLDMLFDANEGPAARTFEDMPWTYPLVGRLLHMVPGFPQPVQLDLGLPGRIPHFLACPARCRPLAAEMGLGPAPDTASEFMDELTSNFDEYGGYDPANAAELFFAIVDSAADDAPGRRDFALKHLPAALCLFKSPLFFSASFSRGYLDPRPTLVDALLLWPDQLDDADTVQRPCIFRSLHLVLSRLGHPPSASHLASAVALAAGTSDIAAAPGLRGVVRLLLHHGADTADPFLRAAVLGHGACEKYEGFAADVRDARCWARWIERRSLRGMPEELVERIALATWEALCWEEDPESEEGEEEENDE